MDCVLNEADAHSCPVNSVSRHCGHFHLVIASL